MSVYASKRNESKAEFIRVAQQLATYTLEQVKKFPILNVWLGLAIWDYSNLPFNIMGQICLPFFFAWIALSAVAIVVDDYLRYWLFKEEKPHYQLM